MQLIEKGKKAKSICRVHCLAYSGKRCPTCWEIRQRSARDFVKVLQAYIEEVRGPQKFKVRA